jgi:hypothetical protein
MALFVSPVISNSIYCLSSVSLYNFNWVSSCWKNTSIERDLVPEKGVSLKGLAYWTELLVYGEWAVIFYCWISFLSSSFCSVRVFIFCWRYVNMTCNCCELVMLIWLILSIVISVTGAWSTGSAFSSYSGIDVINERVGIRRSCWHFCIVIDIIWD